MRTVSIWLPLVLAACADDEVLRVRASLTQGDLEACLHIHNVGISVEAGPTMLGNGDALGFRDSREPPRFEWDFGWDDLPVPSGTQVRATFYGDGEARTQSQGESMFAAAPGTLQTVDIPVECRYANPDASLAP